MRGVDLRALVRLGAAAIVLAVAPPMASGRAPEVGEPAPALSVPQLDGHGFDLAALRGKVVIVNFWATWCAPCRDEMPEFTRIQQELAAKGVQFVGIAVASGMDFRFSA